MTPDTFELQIIAFFRGYCDSFTNDMAVRGDQR